MFGQNLFELSSAPLQRSDDSISCVAFDSHEEILWTGSNGGALQSFLFTNLQKYSVFDAHLNPVISISSSLEGVTSVSSERIKIHSRGGFPIFSHGQANWNISCCGFERNENKILLGHFNSYISLFDISTKKTISNTPTFQPITALKCNNRFAYFGKSNGQICILDLRTFKVESTIDAHLGGVISLDTKNDLLVSCGCVQKLNQVYTDPLVKVFDIRSGFRSLKNVSFLPGPSLLTFHPKFSSLLLVASQSGKFLFTDIQANNTYEYFQVDCEGSGLSACDVSNSGELLAFGDYEGFVHLWGSSDKSRINIFSMPTELPQNVLAQKKMSEQNFSPLPHRISSTEPLFSRTEPEVSMTVGLPPRQISPHILNQIRVIDFVGFVENPNWKRGTPYAKSCQLSKDLIHTRVQPQGDVTVTSNNEIEVLKNAEKDKIMLSILETEGYTSSQNLPKMYQRVEINQSKFAKFEEFDFSCYNKTKFAGLENDNLNSYINSLIHVLYFLPCFHAKLLRHFCAHELCISCELKFVFEMMTKAKGKTIQVSNFLRTLRHNFTSVSLGIIDNPNVFEIMKQENLSKCIRMFCRFLFKEIEKENLRLNKEKVNNEYENKKNKNSENNFMDEIFGIKYQIKNECLGNKHDAVIEEKKNFQIDIEYPSFEFERFDFLKILEWSLNKKEEIFDFCHSCNKPQTSIQKRKLIGKLPSYLLLNCKLKERNFFVNEEKISKKNTMDDFKKSFMNRISCFFESSWKYATSSFIPWLPNKFVIKCGIHGVRVLEENSSMVEMMSEAITEKYGSMNEDIEKHIHENENKNDNDNDNGNESANDNNNDNENKNSNKNENKNSNKNENKNGDEDVKHHECEKDYKNDDDYGVYDLRAVIFQIFKNKNALIEKKNGLHEKEKENYLMGEESHLISFIKLPTFENFEKKKNNETDLQYENNINNNNNYNNGIKMNNDNDLYNNNLKDGEKWYLFNDFFISETSKEEMMNLYNYSKHPCIFFYSKINKNSKMETDFKFDRLFKDANEYESEAMFEQFQNLFLEKKKNFEMKNFYPLISKSSFSPLNILLEKPRPGTIFGIDAEFVVLSPENVKKKNVKMIPRLGLARVSVVRGDGADAGKCCIDDYISNVEPVYDYITRYSGIHHGDLDESISKHHVTTLKKIYLKLKYLVDSGCVFVGHGLKKDFKIINIFVPSNQIIDTVEIFYLNGQRKLSLRFLSSYLLNLDIQSETHDSIEDALTALKLYQIYGELIKEGNFEEKLQEIYQYGRNHGWEVAKK